MLALIAACVFLAAKVSTLATKAQTRLQPDSASAVYNARNCPDPRVRAAVRSWNLMRTPS
jgi:hypothetical protein